MGLFLLSFSDLYKKIACFSSPGVSISLLSLSIHESVTFNIYDLSVSVSIESVSLHESLSLRESVSLHVHESLSLNLTV